MTDSLHHWTQVAATSGARLLALLLGAIVLIRVLRVLTRRMVALAKSEARVAKMREQQTRTLAGLLDSVGTALIVAGAILLALPELGFNVTPIAAVAGLASLAFGFGAQYLVRDIINGFFIVFEDQYVVGDTIRVGDRAGRVEHLTLRRTLLRDDQGALVSIPNGLIGQVANLSRDWSQVWVDVVVPADESTSRALAALEEVAREFRADPGWSAALVDGPRVLGIESLTLSGTTLRVQTRTGPLRKDDVGRELRRRIRERFEQDQLRLSSAQRVELVGSETRAPADAPRRS